jgi:hypothetical protein
MLVLNLIIKYSDSKKISLLNLQKKIDDASYHKRNPKPNHTKI